MVMKIGGGLGGAGGFGRKDNDDDDKKKGNVNNNNRVKSHQDDGGNKEKKTENEGTGGRKNPLSGLGNRMRDEARDLAHRAHALLGHGPSAGDIGNRLKEAGKQLWGAMKIGGILVPGLILTKIGSWLSKVGSSEGAISKKDISGPKDFRPLKTGNMEYDLSAKGNDDGGGDGPPDFIPDPPNRRGSLTGNGGEENPYMEMRPAIPQPQRGEGPGGNEDVYMTMGPRDGGKENPYMSPRPQDKK